MRLLLPLLLLSISLAACAPHQRKTWDNEDDFKPYILSQQDTIPGAYPRQDWGYRPGTPTGEIITRWKNAGLIKRMMNVKGSRQLEVGPQFYNLPLSGQAGLADTVAQIYNAQNYLLVDGITKRPIGTYAVNRLQMY